MFHFFLRGRTTLRVYKKCNHHKYIQAITVLVFHFSTSHASSSSLFLIFAIRLFLLLSLSRFLSSLVAHSHEIPPRFSDIAVTAPAEAPEIDRYAVGATLQVCDTRNKWLPAVVVEANEEQ